MAEWQKYQDGNIPAPIPPVDLAWEDMRRRLDQRRPRYVNSARRITLTGLFLACWLVILEPIQENKGRNYRSPEALPQASAFAEPPLADPGTINATADKGKTPVREKRTTGPKHHDLPAETGRIPEGSGQQATVMLQDQSQAAMTAGTKDENATNKRMDSIVHPPQPDKDPSKATEDKNDEENKKEDEKWQLHGGFQWDLEIPLNGLDDYFHGPGNDPQPWRRLIPGIFLEAVQGKNALNFSFMPMFSQTLPVKTFRVQDSLFQNADTIVQRQQQKGLYTLLGMQASLGYARNLKGKWWGGLNLNANFWGQALAISDVMDQITVGQVASTRSYTERYRISDEWSYFNKMQMSLDGSLQYHEKNIQAFLKAGVALTPLSKEDGPGHIFRASLGLRYLLKKTTAKKAK